MNNKKQSEKIFWFFISVYLLISFTLDMIDDLKNDSPTPTLAFHSFFVGLSLFLVFAHGRDLNINPFSDEDTDNESDDKDGDS